MTVPDPLPTLLLTLLAGYLIGALPIADQISRRQGVDIFSTGTGLAGASNIRRSVGNRSAMIVLLSDLGKGALVILVARYAGIGGPWVLLPAMAALVGQWKSVFSRFRGGDGNALLGGILIALFALSGVIAVLVALIVSLGGQRLPYSSLMNILAGYLTLAALVFANDGDLPLTLGTGGLCALVLARAIYGHIKRRRDGSWEDFEDTDGAPDIPTA